MAQEAAGHHRLTFESDVEVIAGPAGGHRLTFESDVEVIAGTAGRHRLTSESGWGVGGQRVDVRNSWSSQKRLSCQCSRGDGVGESRRLPQQLPEQDVTTGRPQGAGFQVRHRRPGHTEEDGPATCSSRSERRVRC